MAIGELGLTRFLEYQEVILPLKNLGLLKDKSNGGCSP